MVISLHYVLSCWRLKKLPSRSLHRLFFSKIEKDSGAPMWALLRGAGRCNRHGLPLEAEGKTVVEEEQLAVREQAAEQGV